MKKVTPYFLLIIALTEGANLMAIELGAAKLLAPYFGTSLYAWAATLGITLLALMLGYFIGGIISVRYNSNKTLYIVLLIASCLICISPVLAAFFLNKLYLLPVQLGSTLGLISYAFLPLFFLAISSPLMVQEYQTFAKSTGNAAGTIYSISTLGGIFATFFCGFYALPFLGISNTLMAFSFILFILSLLFISTKSKLLTIIFIIIFILCALLSNQFNKNENSLYQSEGILGKIEVKDGTYFSFIKNEWVDGRAMLVNGTGQSIADKTNNPYYTWHYVEVANKIAANYKNKKCLLLGMGAGIVAQEFAKNEIEISAVELDSRIPYIAEKYFIGKNNFNIIVDDARHYINSDKNSYDIIFIDLFFSETPPAHVLTKQAFTKIKNMLNNNGILLINLYGFSSGIKATPLFSIYNTLKYCGYNIKTIATKGEEYNRNILLLANCNSNNISINHSENYTLLNFETNNTLPIITDNTNPLEVYFLKPASAWRSGWNSLLNKE